MSGAATAVGTLLVQSPHHKGIVTELTQVMGQHEATVVDSSHFSDASSHMFFQRVQFDASLPPKERAQLERSLADLGERNGMRFRIWYPDRQKRIAILASKQEHCLYDLLIRHRAGELACTVALVLSNHPAAGPIAEHFGVPFHYLPVTPDTKQRQESRAIELIDAAQVDVIVLARYM